jgi:hypothetical protein
MEKEDKRSLGEFSVRRSGLVSHVASAATATSTRVTVHISVRFAAQQKMDFKTYNKCGTCGCQPSTLDMAPQHFDNTASKPNKQPRKIVDQSRHIFSNISFFPLSIVQATLTNE